MKPVIFLILIVAVACLDFQKGQSDLTVVQTDTLAPATGNAYSHVPIQLGSVLPSKEDSLRGDSIDLKNRLESVNIQEHDIGIK